MGNADTRRAAAATISALIAVVCACAGVAAAAPTCGPAAIVDGAPEVVAQVAQALAGRGLAPPPAGCPAERARVIVDGDALVVSIVDADGRHAERRVGDVATAAALIESFAGGDAGDELPVPAEPAVVAPQIDLEEPPAEIERVAPVSEPRGTLAVGLETSAGGDRSLWLGTRVAGCVRLGRTCVGAVGRFASAVAPPDAVEGGEAQRVGADVLIAGEYQLGRVDGWSIAPGVGVGVGWLRVRQDYLADAMSPADTLEVDTGGLRAEAHVAATVPLARGLHLRLGASLDVSPLAHTQPFSNEGHDTPGESRMYARIDIGVEVDPR